MPLPFKFLAALSAVAISAACVPSGSNNRVDTVGEIEATTDTAIIGDTVPGAGGAQVQP